MALSKHVDPEELLRHLNERPASQGANVYDSASHHARNFTYGSRYQAVVHIPKFEIPENGTDGTSVHQLIKDDLDLDGRPNLNLASFVNTYMEPTADQLFMENISKNLADADEYPGVMAIHSRCVSMLANLWKIPKGQTAIGTATTGSSEGIHLGGLAMKRLWQERRRREGKSTENPNIIMGANAQVALEKFARYFEVEARILSVSEESHYCLDAKLIRENIDENTIGIFIILGSTYTGHYEPVAEIAKILDDYEAETGTYIPIHVDAASGGFVAPFVNYDQPWGFEIPRVHSIQASGHKFGLVYPGLGWVLWRGEEYLPKALVFELHYLGGVEETYTLNFSRPAAQVVVQYYNFLMLGKEGYSNIMRNCLQNARILSKALEKSGWFTCVSDIHRRKGIWTLSEPSPDAMEPEFYNAGLPVVTFRFSDEFKQHYKHVKQQSVSTLLRARGYIIPNYTLPPAVENVEVLRVVVRENMSADLLDLLIRDIFTVTETLMGADEVDLEAFAKVRAPRIEKVLQSMGLPQRRNSWGGVGAVLRTTC